MLKKIHFPNLNELRFLAALIVLIHHVEQFKSIFGISNYWNNPSIVVIGKLGVIMFFVLSGFLITYLLLIEQERTKTIAIKNFYWRRILRIWPLYFLIILLSFFILPNISFFNIPIYTDFIKISFWIKITLFVAFLPNLALILFPAVPFASQLWSIGVEEIFYLVWPILMKKRINKILLMYLVIFSYVLLKISLIILVKFGYNFPNLSGFLDVFNFDCMAIGGLFSILLYMKCKYLKAIFHPLTQILTVVVTLILIFRGYKIPYLHEEVYGAFFGIFILNIAANPKSLISIKNKVLSYLGKISYGIYMFHPLAIVATLKLMGENHNIFLQYVGSVSISIILAFLSYQYFELRFIEKKISYTNVISG